MIFCGCLADQLDAGAQLPGMIFILPAAQAAMFSREDMVNTACASLVRHQTGRMPAFDHRSDKKVPNAPFVSNSAENCIQTHRSVWSPIQMGS
jgi:hypothetical protein